MSKKFDFGGYATKVDLKCADGRVIKRGAFKENNGTTVPLVWQHTYNSPDNVLGHALLEDREDGVYAYCKFNSTPAGENAKALVEHGDITALSIHANQLKQQGPNVVHGMIREVSLVLAGANPGALIDNLNIQHSDGGFSTVDSEAIIYMGGEISTDEEELEHEGLTDKTVGDVFESLTEEQKEIVYAMISHALENGTQENITHTSEGGNKEMKKNVFEQHQEQTQNGGTLTHDQMKAIFADAQKSGSLKDAVLAHAAEYGIENIDILFPEAKTLSRDPEWLKREDDWVAGVLGGIHKSPFSRVKSIFADMDIDTARAKGYVKATEKKEVYFKCAKRVTTPTTVYVKQKLDRDDMIDVTDFDTVAMIRYQLRTLLDEELAQAALFGDGREVSDPYKINEENIRPIWTDEDLFTVKEKLTTKTDYKAIVKEIALSHKRYKGSGAPVLYMTPDLHTNLLWIEDTNGRRIYESDATLCAALRVSKIIEIPQMEGKKRTVDSNTHELMAIKVNLKDYNFGADKGGQVSTFDDFDIDYNQYKYLMETRCSGALTKAKAAQVYEFVTVG